MKRNAGPEYEAEVKAAGNALADAAFDRGLRLTAAERATLTHWARWGSTGYPISRLGRGWVVDSTLIRGAGIFRTKYEAVRAWEIVIAKLIRLSGLEAYEQAMGRDVAPRT